MAPMPPKEISLPFVKKEHVAADAYEFFFDRRAVNFDFSAGQYIRMFLDIPQPDERGITRLFSLTTAPQEKRYLSITTRIMQSMFKKTLASLQPGAFVRFFGPMGRFMLEETDTRPRIFIAGGIGVTPFRSMLRYAIMAQLTTPIMLFASYKSVEDGIYYQEFSSFMKEHSWFRYIPTITQPKQSDNHWDGLTGRLTQTMLLKNIPNFKQSVYYIAGPMNMVDSQIDMLAAMGIPPEQIKKEKFTGY
jgi:glycine betaine catabolism B